MKIIYGDLIELAKDGHFDVIVHGCNCICTMGAGIAKQIKKEFPKAWEIDKRTKSGDRTKLGKIVYTKVFINDIHSIFVVNAYTQFDTYVRGEMKKVLVEYDALRSCFAAVYKLFHGYRIGYPKIGAGLALGDWNIISKIIDEELKEMDHTLVIWR
jgi:O-acetyl-ADP-ribose deacetylase (regulator of RNase III)